MFWGACGSLHACTCKCMQHLYSPAASTGTSHLQTLEAAAPWTPVWHQLSARRHQMGLKPNMPCGDKAAQATMGIFCPPRQAHAHDAPMPALTGAITVWPRWAGARQPPPPIMIQQKGRKGEGGRSGKARGSGPEALPRPSGEEAKSRAPYKHEQQLPEPREGASDRKVRGWGVGWGTRVCAPPSRPSYQAVSRSVGRSAGHKRSAPSGL